MASTYIDILFVNFFTKIIKKDKNINIKYIFITPSFIIYIILKNSNSTIRQNNNELNIL